MAITKVSPDVVNFDSALVVSPTLTIGDATAEDTKIVFDGNAQDFYIGLDDSADDLIIGKGSTVGTTPAISIDENLKSTFSGEVTVNDTVLVNDDLSVQGAAPTLQLYDTTVTNNLTKFEYDETFLIDIDKNNARGSSKLEVKIDGSSAFTIDSNRDVAIPDGGLTITTSDNTPQLSLVSTDADANIGPVLELWRNSASPADNDELARIYFYGENDNDEKVEYALIKSNIVDASDGAEGSSLQIYTYSTGGQRNRIDLLEGETVFNEGSQDIDFRVESTGSANMLFVDAGNDRVGVGTSPDYRMHIFTSDSSAGAHGNADDLFIENSGNAGMTIGSGTTSNGSIFFSDSDSTLSGQIEYRHNGDSLMFVTGGGNRLRVDSDGIKFGSDTATASALDDYEEGTWTPAYTNTTESSSMTGHYVKVGGLVYITFYSGNQTLSSSNSSAAYVTGLPFTPSGYYAPISVSHHTCFAHTNISPYIQSGAKQIYFVVDGTFSSTTWTDGAGKYLMVAGTYSTTE